MDTNILLTEEIIGFDTAKFGFSVSMQQMDLNNWRKCEWSSIHEEDETLIHLYYIKTFKSSNGTLLTLKYLPYDYKRRSFSLLLIEFSFPKLIYGNNHRNIQDWQSAFDCANTEIANIPGLPPLPDLRDAVLYRLDICANFQVGKLDVEDYLQVLSKCKHPHRETQSYTGQSAVFASREIRTSFYDKYKECKMKETEGILRLETQFLTKRSIGQLAAKKYLTLRQITAKMIGERLLKELQILHLDHSIICDELEITHVLTQKYSNCQVQSMLGYWIRKRTSTREQMIRDGYTRRTICRYEKLFTKAGVSSNSSESKKTLPALSLFFQERDKNCNKPPSVTRSLQNIQTKKEVDVAKKRGQGEGSIFKRKNGLWVAQMTIQGKHVTKYFKSQGECREWLRQTQAQVENGLTLSGAQTTVAAFLRDWLILNETSVRPKTSDQYQQIVGQHILSDLGMIKLKDLNARHIQALYGKKLESGTSARTVILIHAVLRRALNHALKLGMIGRNPALAVVRPKFKRKEMKTLTDNQVRTLLSLAEGDRFEFLYWLAVTTGLRQGELLGLRWSDVDWVNRRLRIQRQLQRLRGGLVFSEPKSAAGRRVIALGATSIEKLRKHQNLQVGETQSAGQSWKENDMIFPSSTGTPMDPSNLYHNFKRLLKQAGLPDIRFHDLRHTAATLMLQQGIHPKIVQERLGHSDISMTLNTYSHVLPAMQDEAAGKLDELLTPINVSNELKKLGERESSYILPTQKVG